MSVDAQLNLIRAKLKFFSELKVSYLFCLSWTTQERPLLDFQIAIKRSSVTDGEESITFEQYSVLVYRLSPLNQSKW